jgi:hypothetical protein
MKKWTLIVILGGFLVVVSSCAHRHYLGFHGPSIKLYPDVHEGVADDEECLECHHPDKQDEEASGPPPTHPNFTGCLKCHNDDV